MKIERKNDVQGMTSYHQPDGWISVKDRLPDTSRYVIACSDLGDIFECWYHTVGKYWVKDGIIVVKNITHWRELPDPPKMEERIK